MADEPSAPAVFSQELASKLDQPITTMELSVRAGNCLESAKIHTVGDLARMTDAQLLKVRSFGKTSLREVKRKLQDMGLSLGMAIPESESETDAVGQEPAAVPATADAQKA